PAQDFPPNPGAIKRWEVRDGDQSWLRIDTHVESGYKVPPFYDSLLAKVLVEGDNRSDACRKMLQALQVIQCEGIKTTIPLHVAIVGSSQFQKNNHQLGMLLGWEQS